MPINPVLTESYIFEGQIFLPGLTNYPDGLAKAIEAKSKQPAVQDSVFYTPPTSSQLESVTPVGLAVELPDDFGDEDDVVLPVQQQAPQPEDDEAAAAAAAANQPAQPDPNLVDSRIPFFQELIDGGVTTIQELYEKKGNLTDISGIGQARAAEINKWIDENVVVQ